MIAIDLESSCNGLSEYRVYREGFQIDSIAASWRDESGAIRSWFSNKSSEIDKFIRRLAETQKPLVVHNLQFELGVFLKLFPNLEFNWASDTLRLAQLLDNTGGLHWSETVLETADDEMDRLLDGEDGSGRPGLGLEACASRYLPKIAQNHKSAAHTWLSENHGITKNHGQHLHLLPYEQLKQYNIADTETTLLLYEELTEQLRLLNYDPAQDWVLYKSRVTLMAGAYLRGLKIDREALRAEIYKVDAEVKEVLREFLDATVDARREWAIKFPGKVKSRPVAPGDFNIGSNTQLKQLFIDVLGVVGGRTTKTGQSKIYAKEITAEQAAIQYPSFQSKHLVTWGPLGGILYKRRKLLLVLQQMLGVYHGSSENGRLYCETRASGTVTGRVAGGIGIK